MQEKNQSLREALYELFSIIKLNKQTLLLDVIKALRENITKYPQDRMVIYTCGAKLGTAYAEFVKLNAMIILQHDPNYLVREHDQDDSTHIFHVIIVANALANSKSAQEPKLPFYFTKYNYFSEP